MGATASNHTDLSPTRIWALSTTAIALLAATVHLGTLSNEFVFDDHWAIVNNPNIAKPFDLAAHFSSGFWGPGYEQIDAAWRPATTLGFALNRALLGVSPLAIHLVNLLLHAACSVLVANVARAVGLSARWALVAAALFAVHPLHVEAIAYGVGRADLQMAAFGLAAILAWQRGRLPIALGLLTLALLSKEMGAALIVVFLWLDLKATPRNWRWPWALLVIIVWLAARYAALGTLTGASPSRVENPLVDASFTTTLLTAGALHFHAISLFVFPATLLADYSLSTIPPSVSLDGASIAGWLLLLAAAAGIVTAFKRDPPLSFALTLWLGPYLLVSHLGVTMPTYFAERVLYLPSAGLVLALGWTLATVSQRWPIEKPALAFVGIAGVLLTWRSVVRVDDWQDNATLHARTMEDAPDNVKALCNAAGEFLALGYDEAALAAISHALKVDDSVALVHVNAATLYTSLGQQAEAKQHLDRVAELHEGSVRLSAARCAYAARFDPPSAKEPCKRATESQFADVESWMFRAMAADRVGDAADAEASFQHAFASSSLPPVKLLYNYAMFLARQRRFEQARELLQVATRRDPASEEVRVGLQRVEAVMRGR